MWKFEQPKSDCLSLKHKNMISMEFLSYLNSYLTFRERKTMNSVYNSMDTFYWVINNNNSKTNKKTGTEVHIDK